MADTITYSFMHSDQRVEVEVPRILHESIELHAENRKVPVQQVYCEALDGSGPFVHEIRERLHAQIVIKTHASEY